MEPSCVRLRRAAGGNGCKRFLASECRWWPAGLRDEGTFSDGRCRITIPETRREPIHCCGWFVRHGRVTWIWTAVAHANVAAPTSLPTVLTWRINRFAMVP